MPKPTQYGLALSDGIPRKTHFLDLDAVDCVDGVRVKQTAVKPLREIHIRAAFRKLFQQLVAVRAGQQICVHQLDLTLAAPELREVGALDAFLSLLT